MQISCLSVVLPLRMLFHLLLTSNTLCRDICNVLLPESELYGFNPELLSECQEFSRDDSHRHDDQVDCLVYLIMNTIAKLTVSIYDVID